MYLQDQEEAISSLSKVFFAALMLCIKSKLKNLFAWHKVRWVPQSSEVRMQVLTHTVNKNIGIQQSEVQYKAAAEVEVTSAHCGVK